MAGITMKGPSIIQAVRVLRCHQYTKHTLCSGKENTNRSASFQSSCLNISTVKSKSSVTSFHVIPNLRPLNDRRYVSLTCILTNTSRPASRNHNFFYSYSFVSGTPVSWNYSFVKWPTAILHSSSTIYSSSLSLSCCFMHLPINRSVYLPYQTYELTSE